MWEFFLKIWKERPHYCIETGKWLGKEPKTTMFHHLLHKKPYPEYELERWNIAVLHPDIHTLAHQNLDATPNVKRLTEEAWKKHLTISS